MCAISFISLCYLYDLSVDAMWLNCKYIPNTMYKFLSKFQYDAEQTSNMNTRREEKKCYLTEMVWIKQMKYKRYKRKKTTMAMRIHRNEYQTYLKSLRLELKQLQCLILLIIMMMMLMAYIHTLIWFTLYLIYVVGAEQMLKEFFLPIVIHVPICVEYKNQQNVPRFKRAIKCINS